LISYEGRLKADIRVTTLPPGMDPDDVVNQDPAQWVSILESAKPIVMHVLDTLTANQDVNDPKVKSEIARQVLPLINDVPDSLERETYRQRLARMLKVDERALIGEMRSIPARQRRRSGPGRGEAETKESPALLTPSNRGNRYLLETHCLAVLMRHPEMIYQVDRLLQEEKLARISSADFDRAEFQTIFQLIQESLEQDIAEPLNYVLNNLSLELIEEVDGFLAHTAQMEMKESRLLEDLFRTILELRQREIRQNIDHLRYVMEEAQDAGNLESGELQKSIANYTLILNLLDHARGRSSTRATSQR
jgi:DNA primase